MSKFHKGIYVQYNQRISNFPWHLLKVPIPAYTGIVDKNVNLRNILINV